MARLATISLPLALILAVGCSSSDESKGDKPEAAKKEKSDKPKSNVKRIVTAVPSGKTVACTDLFPDISHFKELVADDIGEVKDRGKSNHSVSAVCAFMRGGEPPKNDSQLRKMKQENMKLGVLPGDEYCTVSINCTLATDESDFKDKCEADAKRESDRGSRTQYVGNNAIGQFSCVRKTDRPPSDWAYTYKTIDPDTRCLVEVMGGPSVTDEELVQHCTLAAVQSITMANLKKYD